MSPQVVRAGGSPGGRLLRYHYMELQECQERSLHSHTIEAHCTVLYCTVLVVVSTSILWSTRADQAGMGSNVIIKHLLETGHLGTTKLIFLATNDYRESN